MAKKHPNDTMGVRHDEDGDDNDHESIKTPHYMAANLAHNSMHGHGSKGYHACGSCGKMHGCSCK